MKFKMIIDKTKEEEIVATVHGPSELTRRIEQLVLGSTGTDRITAYIDDEWIVLPFEEIACITVMEGKTFDEIETEFAGQGYGAFKPKVGEAVVETLRPIREETTRLLKDKAYLESVYRDGAQKASYVAEKTLRKVYKKVGFVAR